MLRKFDHEFEIGFRVRDYCGLHHHVVLHARDAKRTKDTLAAIRGAQYYIEMWCFGRLCQQNVQQNVQQCRPLGKARANTGDLSLVQTVILAKADDRY